MKRLIFALVFLFSMDARATVLSSTRTTGAVTGTGGTTFTVAFPYIDQSHLVVTRTLVASPYTAVVLTLGSTATTGYYTVSPTSLAQSGTVTIGAAISSAYTITVTRVVPVTQPTSYRTQGSYLPKTHEASFDRLTMMIQDVLAGAVTAGDFTTAIDTHKAADDHTMYLKLAGRAGGQIAYGGTSTGGLLVLHSTAHATKGLIYLGTSYYDEATPGLYLDGTLSVAGVSSFVGAATFDAALYGGNTNASVLILEGSSIADASKTASKVNVGVGTGGSVVMSVDEYNSRVGIKTTSPSEELHVVGDALVTGAVRGSASASGSLYLGSTSDATKGYVYIQNSGNDFTWDQTNARLGIKRTAPLTYNLDVNGTSLLDGYIYGSDAVGGDMSIFSTTDATKGTIYLGASTAYAGVTESTGAIFARRPVVTMDGNATANLTTMCNGVYLSGTAKDADLTLPAAATANKGCMITLASISAATAFTVKLVPNAADGIAGSCGSAAMDGTVNKHIINTLATHAKGDAITFVSSGASGTGAWYILSCTGVWARQT